MPLTTFKLKVLTPLFMGGANPQGKPELRSASIKGAMRFWFRAIAGAVTSNPKDVYRLESEIFGNTEKKSKVVVRVLNQKSRRIQKGTEVPLHLAVNPETLNKNNKMKQKAVFTSKITSKIELAHKLNFLAYLANMGLAEYDKQKGFVWTRNGFDAGTLFKVEVIGTSKKITEIASNTFQVAVLLGGFGSRWRHGFGSCEILEENQKPFEKIELQALIDATKALTEELAQSITLLSPMELKMPPVFPTLSLQSSQIWEGILNNCNKSWSYCLSYIGKLYREFRIKDGNNLRYGHTWDFLNIIGPIFEKKEKKLIKSNNPRNDIFGLPIQFSKFYKVNNKRISKTAIINVEKEEINRRASPLILHVEPQNNLVRATLFISKFIPDDAKYFVDFVDKDRKRSLKKPDEKDFQRIEHFLKDLGLTRRYPDDK